MPLVADVALVGGQLNPVLNEGEIGSARRLGEVSIGLLGAPVNIDVTARAPRARWARFLFAGSSLFHPSNPRGLSWHP